MFNDDECYKSGGERGQSKHNRQDHQQTGSQAFGEEDPNPVLGWRWLIVHVDVPVEGGACFSG